MTRQGANYVVFIFGKSAQENLIAEKKMASFTSVKIIDFGFAVDIGDNKGKLIKVHIYKTLRTRKTQFW